MLWVLGFAYFNYTYEKDNIYNQLDQQLESAALTASLLIPDKLHHQNMMAGDISSQDDNHNISTLSAYTDNSDIAYIYTLILRDNKLFFTSSSATTKERKSGEGLSHYFEQYNDVDPRVFDVFKTKQKVFLEYSDQWGSFRSIFMPRYSSDGTFYIAAADIPTHRVQALLNQQLYRTLAIALLFLVFAYPLYFVANHYIRNKSNNLEYKLHQKTKELAKNQQRLEYALRAARQAWFEVTIPTGEIHVSKEYVALVGREVLNNNQESTIDNWKNNIHPDDREATIEKFQQGLKQDEPSSIEFRRKLTDGSWAWIQSTGQVIKRDQQGNPITVVGINMDITERKRNEQVLQTLAESVGTTNGDIFQTIVRQLALSHDMRYALIAKINDDATQATTLAFWKDGKLVENFSYPLANTPCETVLDGAGMAFYSENIQHLFPNDHMLVEMQAESYIGISLRDSNNNVIGLISVINDHPIKKTNQTHTLMQSLAVRASFEIERRENDEQLQLFSYIFRDSREGMFLVDKNDNITDVNPSFCTYAGYSKEELLGQPAQIFRSIAHAYPPEFYINIRQKVIENGIWQGELWNKLKNNDEILAAVTVTQITDENNKPTHNFIMVSDITEKKRQQDALKFMAHYDSLTKLPNRTLFVDRFNQAVAHSKRSDTLLAICFLDIDNFKPVNDDYGHEVGDQLLIEVSQRISANLREEDTVSRQGGDEFTLLIGSIESFEQCEQMLKRILQSVAEPYSIDDASHNISASIGVTLYPLDNSDVDTLTRHADHAMYQAKQSGKNQYHLFDALDDQQKSIRRQQQQEINNAIQYNQFCLYYQPKVNMKTGEVYGVEALIRWQHPEKGLLFPLDFLPATENTALEHKIGDWVIQQALLQLDKWQQQGIELEVSVNISSNHLQSSSFISNLGQYLALYPKIDSHSLQLEILESSALGDINTISNIIKECQHSLGVNIALDDFGTGYSSLTHLRNLPAETIKIDRSFVMDLLDDPNDFAIIDGIIGLADAFNREVIAEGVESTEHGLMLLAMNCHNAQGYGIAKPMPASDIPDWLKYYQPNQEWIKCGKQPYSEQKTKIKFIKLTTEKWLNNLNTILKSSNPIHVDKKMPLCHLGVWIEQLRKNNLFATHWLDTITLIHDDLYLQGEQAIQAHLNHDEVAKKNSLQQLQNTFDNLMDHLDYYN